MKEKCCLICTTITLSALISMVSCTALRLPEKRIEKLASLAEHSEDGRLNSALEKYLTATGKNEMIAVCLNYTDSFGTETTIYKTSLWNAYQQKILSAENIVYLLQDGVLSEGETTVQRFAEKGNLNGEVSPSEILNHHPCMVTIYRVENK